MNTTHTLAKVITTAVGSAIAAVAAPAVLFLGAGTAQAIQDVSEAFVAPPAIQDVSDRFVVPAVQDISETFVAPPAVQDVSEGAPRLTVGAFNPQPDTPGVIDPGSRVGIIDPGIKVGITDPGLKVGIGGPDTRPALRP